MVVRAFNSTTYTPYGQFYEGQRVENIDSPWKFTGQWHDAEIDQYYLRARQYDPTMMRFTSRDPVFGKFNEPLTLHRYLYCLNDSANRIDPSGKWSLPELQVVLTTSIDGMIFGAIGGFLEGIVVQLSEWGNGNGFSWAEVGWSSAAGAAAGFTRGLLKGTIIGQVAITKTGRQAFFELAAGFSGGLAKDFINTLRGPSKAQGAAAIHALTINAMLASMW